MANTIVIRELPSQNGVDIKFGQMASAIQNGALVNLGAMVEGKHDVYTATAGANYIVTGVELMYDEPSHLDEYINEANKPFRCEKLLPGAIFAVSAEGLYASYAAAVAGWKVDAVDGKLVFAAGGTGAIGNVIAVFTKGGKKFISFKVKD